MMYRAALLRDLHALEPVRKTFHDIFLKEAFGRNAPMVTLHRDRPPSQVRQHVGRNHLVVCGEFTLGDPVIREHQLLRMRDHAVSRTTSRAVLSSRMPRNRPWRSFP